jgi:hypothetical protein
MKNIIKISTAPRLRSGTGAILDGKASTALSLVLNKVCSMRD